VLAGTGSDDEDLHDDHSRDCPPGRTGRPAGQSDIA
jgi:hypothetical protein